VATSGHSHHPAGLEPALRERFEDACERGGSTLYSTGSSPGFITESLPLVLAGVQRRLDRLTINEYADVSRRPSPKMIFKVMGFGEPPGAAFDPRRLAHLREGFGPSLRATAEALSIPLDDVRATGETATAREDLRIAAGVLRAGTMAAQRITVSGLRAGREVLRFRANWYCSTDTEPAWDLRPTGWRVEVEGDAPLDIDLRFPFPIERMAEISPSYTANPAVNAVPAVCAAAPGIRTTADLFGPAPQLG
jgi:4-hydroxy-tetrahydrodipicolinate reductase